MTALSLKVAKLYAGMCSRLGRRALREGVGLSVEHRSVLTRHQWATIVDVGANRGQFASAALQVQPNAIVHSFEPLEAPRKIYGKVLSREPHANLYPVAIGPTTSTLSMNVSARDDSSSLLPIGLEQEALFPGTEYIRRETVELVPLTSFLDRNSLKPPALLKIDVQGYELQALEGCSELLSLFSAIYVECSYRELYVGQPLASDIISWLTIRNFSLADVLNTSRDTHLRAIQSDFYFEHAKDIVDTSATNDLDCRHT